MFATTHWSLVLAAADAAAPQAAQALETLCRTYWYPLYAYVRRHGHGIEDAQDLTQEFFARLLEKQSIGLADRERGRFRTFLLTALKRFMVDEWKRAHRAKRGGPPLAFWEPDKAEAMFLAEPATDLTPEKIYERRWAMLLLERVVEQLRDEALQAGKVELFDGLKSLLWGDQETVSYAELAGRLEMSEGALRVAAHRFRQRYRELLRGEIAHTVAQPGEIDDELSHLFEVLS